MIIVLLASGRLVSHGHIVCGVSLCRCRSCPAQGCGNTKSRGSIALWWYGSMLICPILLAKTVQSISGQAAVDSCHRVTVIVFCRCQRSDSGLLVAAVCAVVEQVES